MSLEEAIGSLAATMKRNNELLERVVAGQEAALAKLEGKTAAAGSDTGSTGRGRRSTKKDEAGNSEAAGTAQSDTAAGNAANDTPVSPIAKLVAEIGTDVDKMKAFVAGWTGSTEDQADRQKRVDMLKGMAAHFGGQGYSALVTSADTAKQAIFFVERAKALGVGKVNLKADYDFDGDPAQGDSASAASDDDFG